MHLLIICALQVFYGFNGEHLTIWKKRDVLYHTLQPLS